MGVEDTWSTKVSHELSSHTITATSILIYFFYWFYTASTIRCLRLENVLLYAQIVEKLILGPSVLYSAVDVTVFLMFFFAEKLILVVYQFFQKPLQSNLTYGQVQARKPNIFFDFSKTKFIIGTYSFSHYTAPVEITSILSIG